MFSSKNTVVIVSVILLAAGMFFLGSYTAKKDDGVIKYKLEQKVAEIAQKESKIAELQKSYDSIARDYALAKKKFEADEANSNQKIEQETHEKIVYINSLSTGDSFKLFSDWLSEIAGSRKGYPSSNDYKPNEGLKPVQSRE